MSSSLLRTKNSSKLLKKFLASTTTDSQNAEKSSRSKKRKLQEATSRVPVTEDEIVQRHIKSMLTLDNHMKRPPVQSLKKHPQKRPNMDLALRRLEREGEATQKKQKAANFAVSRNSAAQSQTVHEPTYNKKRHKKEMKKRHLENLARVLGKANKKKAKAKAKRKNIA